MSVGKWCRPTNYCPRATFTTFATNTITKHPEAGHTAPLDLYSPTSPTCLELAPGPFKVAPPSVQPPWPSHENSRCMRNRSKPRVSRLLLHPALHWLNFELRLSTLRGRVASVHLPFARSRRRLAGTITKCSDRDPLMGLNRGTDSKKLKSPLHRSECHDSDAAVRPAQLGHRRTSSWVTAFRYLLTLEPLSLGCSGVPLDRIFSR
ncbi:hypothetical protein IWX49DRAFT_177741 [Phyllosticta citricarpa]|uniref:Uncharacterized protein n=2 Tax=Phyllosticta TaxID=121621 RepID=A0ABR1M497_9PEZI